MIGTQTEHGSRLWAWLAAIWQRGERGERGDVAAFAIAIAIAVAGAGYFAAFSLFRHTMASLLVFVPIALVAAMARRFCGGVTVWVPLAVFLDAFARLRGHADDTTIPIQHTALLNLDQALFGGAVPTVWLQAHLLTRGQYRPYDYLAVALHWSHFVAPVTTLFALWLTRPAHFRRYYLAFIALTTLVLIGYFLCPATPPWLAAREGYLPPLARPMVTMATALNRSLFGDIYAAIGSTNDVAAMPSLHAAYPCLMAVMFWPVSRRLGLLGLAYSLLMSLALVYLAEHYVVDILASAVCVCIAARCAYAIDARLPTLPVHRPWRAPMPVYAGKIAAMPR